MRILFCLFVCFFIFHTSSTKHQIFNSSIKKILNLLELLTNQLGTVSILLNFSWWPKLSRKLTRRLTFLSKMTDKLDNYLCGLILNKTSLNIFEPYLIKFRNFVFMLQNLNKNTVQILTTKSNIRDVVSWLMFMEGEIY